ncbi:hypothetical protein [Lentzea sp. NPDC060358]|uniref:hypothetical protein n=1 Tax=Lentzea sp. NPDC060358 TaxID=3347103 RepID=UPI003663933C
MSEEKEDKPAAAAEQKPSSQLSPDEPQYMLNVAQGAMHGAQTGSVSGNVNVYNSPISAPADLIVRYATPQDVEDVRREFVPPGNYDDALTRLRREHVVMLRGEGTGRTFTAHRMLAHEFGITKIADMNRARTLDSVREAELEPGIGLVLDGRGSRDQPISDRDFAQCLNVVKDAQCRLVILLDHNSRTPANSWKHVVSLTPPSAVEVAQAALRRRGHADEVLLQMIKTELAPALEGAAPDKAVLAADFAVRIHSGELDVAKAVAALKEEVTEAVAHWFADKDVHTYAYSFAVAVLENQPFEHVAQRARALDEEIRKARLPEDKKLRPRCVFDLSKDRMLQEICAKTEVRDHPKHKDMFEETIRFERHDWASGVFKHMWRQYPAAQEILRDWMCDDATLDRYGEESLHAVCEVVRTVPAHEPLAIVESLGSHRRYGSRALAARAMAVLMDDALIRPIVEKTLKTWTKSGTAYQKSTVALVYSSEFGRRDLAAALEKLTAIGRSEYFAPQNAVVGGMLRMLLDKEIRGIAIETVLSWTGARYRRTGLQQITLALALWVAGIHKLRHDYFVEFGEAFPNHVKDLLKHAFADEEHGEYLLEHFGELALHARWDDAKAAELIRLTRLIAPDLSWWQRRDAVDALTFQHPTKRSEIHRIFRIARKVQKLSRRGAVPLTTSANAGSAP